MTVLLFNPDKPFYKGNLHLHTTNSDGRKSPEEAIDLYQRAGYDFLAVTDHWKRTVEDGYYKNMLLLPGIEIDYNLPDEVIHIVGVGMDERVLELKEKRHLSVQKGIDTIRACGGLAILAHPAWSLNTPQTISSLRGIVAAEIFNSVSTPPWNGDRGDSTWILDLAAARGCLLPTVATDDAHFYNGDQTRAYTMLQADSLTREGVMEGLRRGTYYASCAPVIHQVEKRGDEIIVSCSPVRKIIFHSNLFYAAGRSLVGEQLTEGRYTVRRAAGERFIRIILEDEAGRRAWVNPIDLT